MSDCTGADTATDATRAAFLAKRRAARKVKSRRRTGRGAGGVQGSPGPHVDMDSLPSQNLPQKGVSPEQLAPLPCEEPLPSPTPPTSSEIICTIYAKPPNPRLLLVQFDDKSRGKVVIRPQERMLFGPGKRIAVKWQGADLYVLVGRYNRFGNRV